MKIKNKLAISHLHFENSFRHLLKCKCSQASMPIEKLIKAATVVFVIVIVILGLVYLNSSGLLKNILPSFGLENKGAVDSTLNLAIKNKYVIELYFKDSKIIGGDNDYYYFIYDSSVKNNLRIAMNIALGDIMGWYVDPNENLEFKSGDKGFLHGSFADWEKDSVMNIMNQDSFDNALKSMAAAIKNPDIFASWGFIEKGRYTNIGEISKPTSVASLKLRLTGEQPKNA